jgi:acetolactate synthase small subunit
MSVFTVDLKNQPGELARLCEAMASRGVNLILSATSRGGRRHGGVHRR